MFVQIDIMWKLCMSIGAFMCYSDFDSRQQTSLVSDEIGRVQRLVKDLKIGNYHTNLSLSRTDWGRDTLAERTAGPTFTQ